MMHRRVDLNADVGEGVGQDPELIPLVTSVNVACGGHAGDASTMARTIALARAHGASVGAHPSFPDREGFGRRVLELGPDAIEQAVFEQVSSLAAVAAAQGVRLRHVKPHGALYNAASRDTVLADAIARAVRALDPSLVLVGLAGSELIRAGARAGLQTASEAFADRAYRSDGTLLPRDQAGSVIRDPDVLVPRAVAMVCEGAVTSVDGRRVALEIDTICVHGDTPDAAALASRVRRALTEAGVELASISGPGS